MIPLSQKYSAATTEVTRSQLLAAGEAILAADIWHGTGAISVEFSCRALLC
jgi:hypothetical protein